MGWNEPEFVHLSVFLKPSGKGKMSKRESAQLLQSDHSIFIKDLEDLGYTPEGVVNWIALMGWSYDDRTEFFTLSDLIEKFSIEKLNPSPAAINFTKLDHFNGVHIRNLELSDLARRVKPYFVKAGYNVDDKKLIKMMPIIRERLVTLDDAIPFGGFFFKDEIIPDPKDVLGGEMSASLASGILGEFYIVIESAAEYSKDALEVNLRALIDERGYGTGKAFGVLRWAVTGQKVSPPLIESMEIIGKEKVLERIQNAIRLLNDFEP
jgi:glutamyl-tRNA synthetase